MQFKMALIQRAKEGGLEPSKTNESSHQQSGKASSILISVWNVGEETPNNAMTESVLMCAYFC